MKQLAENDSPTLEGSKGDLRALQDKIKAAQTRQEDFERKAQETEQSLVALQKQLAQSASQERLLENQLEQAHQRIRGHQDAITAKQGALHEHLDDLQYVLVLLQRHTRKPPPIAFFDPQQADRSIRRATILATLYPQLVGHADTVRQQIDTLHGLISQANVERQRLETLQGALAQEKQKIQLLIARKSQLREQFSESARIAEKRTRQLAQRAQDVRALINALIEQEQAKRSTRAETGLPIQRIDDPDDVKGHLILPIDGVLVGSFGQKDPAGIEGLAMTLQTSRLQRVVACAPGKVLYADKFRDYGYMIIIAHHEHLLSILSGMDGLFVQPDTYVAGGEPIGRVAANTRLAMELRANNRPIDPLPWLATQPKIPTDKSSKIGASKKI
ncbi:MAG: peptidoglycan DD-metalloendopeptidase family protein [Alphaproteobacteria bacterium GM202ARS2]|nr:peptidoglycan DD-metalloendopeptidase family protein [Alphaproteobacteria bacterium GM202ARS2]